MNKMPIYEFQGSSEVAWFGKNPAIPLCILSVKHIPFESSKYPNGFIQIRYDDYAQDWNTTGLLKCYVTGKGRYAIWGKHRFYEGYEGGIVLRGLPYYKSEMNSIRKLAESYGSIVEKGVME